MILVWLILIPLAGGILAWPAERLHANLPRWISIVVLAVDLVLSMTITQAIKLPGFTGQGHWFAGFNAPWIPQLGISVLLGMDGLAWLLVVLTLGIGIVAIVASWTEVDKRMGFFHFNLMLSLVGTIGVFITLDLFLFFFFWELMLVPMYFIIAIWGHENRVHAAIKFFLFTQGSGLLMIAAIFGIVFVHFHDGGSFTFNYFALLHTRMSNAAETLLMLGFFVAFAVKLPMVPFHTWLPDTHTEAPTAGSIILASLMLKTGAYGLLRFVLPLFPEVSHSFAPVAMGLGVLGILYGAFLAYAQTDLKRLIAYSSVSHLGFALLGIYAWTQLAWQGTVMQLVAHGVSTGALFILVATVQQRLHTRDISLMGGFWADMPRLSSFGAFFAIASLGLPGLGNFIGEFLILIGSFRPAPVFTIIATVGLVPAAAYSLIAIQRVLHGPPQAGRMTSDFGLREGGIMGVLAVAIVFLGVYPQPVFAMAQPWLARLQSISSNPSISPKVQP